MGIVVGEFVVHYNVDWTKQQVMKRMGWQSADAAFWWVLGVDQFIHHATYLAIAAILWRTAT